FSVDSVTEAGLITGGNGESDIPIGATFTAWRRMRVQRDARELPSEEVSGAGEVYLTLRRVQWYGRDIGFVPGGHTALLEVTGDGLMSLAQALVNVGPSEYVSLIGRPPRSPEASS